LLRLSLADHGPLEFETNRLVCFGFSGRDRAVVDRHIKELSEEGVTPPPSVPTIYPVSSYLATTASIVQVQHPRTSGEVEYLCFVSGDGMYVGVGSDHTDRSLERVRIAWSKQACPIVVAPVVWDYRQVKEHWDHLTLRCWTRVNGGWRVYQDGTLSQLLTPEALLELYHRHFGPPGGGLLVCSGTIPLCAGAVPGDAYRIELADPVIGRKISHEYAVEVLPPPVE